MGEAESIRHRLWAGEADATEVLADLLGSYAKNEMYHIDYKSAVLLFSERTLDKNKVKEILSKEVSGFANAGGGVIIWGVRDPRSSRGASGTAASEIDTDKPTLEPVTDAQADELYDLVNTQAANATDPSPSDVRTRKISSSGRHYVVTYVGASDGGPHMAKWGRSADRYMRRRSDRTEPMKHNEVADMFGRRPHAELRPYWDARVRITRVDTVDFGVVLGIENAGRGIALYPAMRLTWRKWRFYTGWWGHLREQDRTKEDEAFVAGGVDHCIHPGARRRAATIDGCVDRKDKLCDLHLNLTLYAAGTKPYEGTLTIPANEMISKLGL